MSRAAPVHNPVEPGADAAAADDATARRHYRAALNRKHQRDFWRRKSDRVAALEDRLRDLQRSPAALRRRLHDLRTAVAHLSCDRDLLRMQLAAVEGVQPVLSRTPSDSCPASPAGIPPRPPPQVPIHSLKAMLDGSLCAKFNALRRDLCFVCTLSPELNAYIERLCQLSIEPVVCTDTGALVKRLDEFFRFKHLLLEHCAPQMRQQVLEIVDAAQVESEFVFAINLPEVHVDTKNFNPGDKEQFMNACKQLLKYDLFAVELVNELHAVNKKFLASTGDERLALNVQRLKVKHRILNLCSPEQRKIVLGLIEECRSRY